MPLMMTVSDPRWKPGREGWYRWGQQRPPGPRPSTKVSAMNDTRLAPYATLLLRLSLGILFLAHGFYMKILGFGFAGTMGYFGSIGYPPVFGVVVPLAETLAGIALILGLWVPLVSLLTLPILAGAALQHSGNGWVFSNSGGGWEFPVFWIVLMLVQAGLGAGAHALDTRRLLGRRAITQPA
jgi:putative oxidoreductase